MRIKKTTVRGLPSKIGFIYKTRYGHYKHRHEGDIRGFYNAYAAILLRGMWPDNKELIKMAAADLGPFVSQIWLPRGLVRSTEFPVYKEVIIYREDV